MLTVRKKTGARSFSVVELEWDRQEDPDKDSRYSCWAPDDAKQGSITFPASMVQDIIKAMITVTDFSSLKEIKLDD